MYTTNPPHPWHSASNASPPHGDLSPLNPRAKGKQRQRSVVFDEEVTILPPNASPTSTPTPTPAPSPTKPRIKDSTLSVAFEMPLPQSAQVSPQSPSGFGYKSSPRFAQGYSPSLPPVPQSPRSPGHQQSRSDPSHFQLPPLPNRAGQRPVISAPLFPVVTDVRMHVEKDPQQRNPTFDFEMRFRVTMTDREMPQ